MSIDKTAEPPSRRDIEISGRRAAEPPRRRALLQSLLPKTVKGRERLRIAVILAGALLMGYLVTWVAYPAPLVSSDIALDRLLGLPLEAARSELTGQGFRVRVENPVADPVIPSGHVVWQDPPPGTLLPRTGSVVSLTPSSGPAQVAIPDVLGFDLDAARQVVAAAGFRIGTVDSLVSSTEAGVIVATRPETGAYRAPGTALDLVVSRGAADIRVPNLVGIGKEDARQRLEDAGLKLGTISTRSGRGNSGVVVEQRPGAGMLSPRGARVSIVIVP
jgi:serine/threonine-protein kinase